MKMKKENLLYMLFKYKLLLNVIKAECFQIYKVQYFKIFKDQCFKIETQWLIHMFEIIMNINAGWHTSKMYARFTGI